MPKARHLEQQQQKQQCQLLESNTDPACKRRSATRGRMSAVPARLTNHAIVLLFCIVASSSAAVAADASASTEEVIESHWKSRMYPYPSLRLVEQSLVTTAKFDFSGRDATYQAAARWNGRRLQQQANQHDDEAPLLLRAPHLACAEYGNGREASYRLKSFLSSAEAVRPVHHSSEHGACFLATCSDAQFAAISADPSRFELTSVGPFPSALKIAPGILDHGDSRSSSNGSSSSSSTTRTSSGSSRSNKSEASSAGQNRNQPAVRLATTHGSLMRIDNIQGLSVELSPGTFPARSSESSGTYTSYLLEDLMSKNVDLHENNFWSDPAMSEGDHMTVPEGALRGREWSRAATVVHALSEAAGTTPGDICSWGGLVVHHAANDVLLVSGANLDFVSCS